MHSLKFIIFSLLLFCLDAKAQESFLIEQLHEKYHNINYYQADFRQSKNVSYISKPLITTGQLEFAVGLGLIWEIKEPLWTKTLINKEGVFKTTKYHKNQKVKDMQIKVIAEIMTELLTANLDKVESKFELLVLHKGDAQDPWQVQLKPKGALMKKALLKIILKGQPADDKIKSGIAQIIIIDQAQNVTTLSLQEKILQKGALSPSLRQHFE